MTFIKLTADDGYDSYINVGDIECVLFRGRQSGGSQVYARGKPYYFRESPETIMKLLGAKVLPEDGKG